MRLGGELVVDWGQIWEVNKFLLFSSWSQRGAGVGGRYSSDVLAGIGYMW